MQLPETSSEASVVRFGVFEFDTRTGELRKSGALVKLQQQPSRVLSLLVTRPGELISRDELRGRIWGGDTFVDFDQGLNFCIKQIRGALGDQADTPRYVETLPRRGYRFIAPTERSAHGAGVVERAPAAPRPIPFRPVAVEPTRATGRSVSAWSRPRWIVAGALGLAGLFALAMLFWDRLTAPSAAPSFKRLTFRRGAVESARFAPDGEVLYTALWDGTQGCQVFATREGTPDTRSVSEGCSYLLGVAGAEMAVRRHDDDRMVLERLPIAGGPPREILEGVMQADWSRDGSSFAVFRMAGRRGRLEFPIGRALYETTNKLTFLRLSPRGDRVAFLEHHIPGDDRGSVVTVDVAGLRTVLSDNWASLEGLAWSPDGEEVWFSGARVGADSSLYAVSLAGQLRTLAQVPGRLVLYDVSPDGRALVARHSPRLEIRYGTPGGPERDLSVFDLPDLRDLSPDGERVLFGESGEAGGPKYAIYLRDVGGAQPVRLGHGRPWSLSPDGRWVASSPLLAPDQLVLLPTGAGESRTVVNPDAKTYAWVGWLSDSRHLVFAAHSEGQPPRIYVQDVEGGPPRAVTPEGTSAWRPVVTADDAFVVAAPGKGQAARLYPLAGGEPKPLEGVQPDDYPIQISGDSGTLYVRRGGVPARIDRIELASGERETVQELRPPDLTGVWMVKSVFVTRDGHAYAYSYGRHLSELYLVDGIH